MTSVTQTFTDVSPELLALYYGYSYPQRVVVGLPQEEISLSIFKNMAGRTVTVDTNGIYPMLKTSTATEYTVVPDNQLPSVVRELFKGSSKFKRMTSNVIQDGKESVKVGEGSLAGIVYRPTTEEQAKRNLNFALANLAAYVDWDETGREEQGRIELAKAKAEAEEKRRKAVADAERALHEARLRNGLDLYNKVNGTRAVTWGSLPYTSPTTRELWAKQAEQVSQLARRSNPYASSIFNSGGLMVDGSISGSSLRANSLYPTAFRL